ncbi:MAG: cobyrinate a,c-diamide synthase [Lachnospiraceae bacterium]|nr:cobyrinate a,c-diamide synthase [Lachnospiraceae bacterium]
MKAARLMIAAPGSGSGKTVITCALLQALKDRGLRARALKCGPDYIDPLFHQKVLEVASRNLDAYFSSQEQVRELFLDGVSEADLSVIEGVMGLYDGLGGIREEASAYHLAGILRTPIVLVVNGKGMARSTLALLEGFLHEDAQRLICGVVLNRVGKAQCELLRPLIEERFGIRVFGYLPERQALSFDSRHLGLQLPEEIHSFRAQITEAAKLLAESVCVEELVSAAQSAEELYAEPRDTTAGLPAAVSRVRLGIARDEAFCFYYEDNLRMLRAAGAELVPFSPIHDEKLPEHVHGLLLGGGYPELWCEQLSENVSMRRAVREAIASGMPSVAECGGFMYLHEWLVDQQGARFALCGVVPGECTYQGRAVRFGYVELTERQGAFLPQGCGIRGHEFHYFESNNNGEGCMAVKPVSGKSWSCVHVGAHHWWGFPHLYYPSAPAYAEHIILQALKYKNCQMEKTVS